VIECGRLPGAGGMTFFTGSAFSTAMYILCQVAAHARHRRIVELGCRQVAFRAQHTGMGACQGEDTAVVECGRFPGRRAMTFFAGCAFGTSMNIILLVAAHAGHRRIAELGCCQVAFCAQHAGMSARQGEDTAVVEGGRFPRRGVMAFFAGSSLSAAMHIFRQMAAYAGGRGALEIAVGVALGALDTNVRAHQLERELIVVKVRDFPCSCIVAGCAVCAEGAAMRIILQVTAHTGHRRITELGCGEVALCTQQCGMFAIQLEYIEVVKGGWLPGRGGMAGFASRSFGTAVYILRLMATYAGHRRALEFAVDMALGALHIDMRAGQFESGQQVVVKAGRLPGSCVVACAAVCSQATQMDIILLVAAHAGHGCIAKLGCVDVAFCAQQRGMLAIQLEYIEVVESGWFPGSCAMAGFASRSFGPAVYILRLVAANTSLRCAFEFTIDMALCTLHFDVCAIQLKGSQVVIKRGWLPCSCVMAGAADCAKCAGMGIIFFVASYAIKWQILELERCRMAVLAQQGGMLAVQHKHIEMVKG
jgi:hypothetical protein